MCYLVGWRSHSSLLLRCAQIWFTSRMNTRLAKCFRNWIPISCCSWHIQYIQVTLKLSATFGFIDITFWSDEFDPKCAQKRSFPTKDIKTFDELAVSKLFHSIFWEIQTNILEKFSQSFFFCWNYYEIQRKQTNTTQLLFCFFTYIFIERTLKKLSVDKE